MKILKAGVWGGISVLSFGIMFFLYSLMYPYSSELGPGAGFFPKWLSGLLIVLAGVYIYEGLVGRDSSDKIDKEGMKKILFILMSMVLYVLLLPILGFNICSAAFLFALLFKAYGLLVNLAISVGASMAFYFLFLLLGVQLPLNALGF